MDSKAVLLMLVLGVLLIAPYALAFKPAGAQIQTNTTSGPWPGTTAQSIPVWAGNISLVNITGEQSTYHWAGVYGNATGKLVLGSGTRKMYEWDAKANYVFFDDDSTVDWTALDGASGSDVDSKYTFLSGASDSGSNTFTNSESITFKSIPNPTNPAYYVVTHSSESTQWKTYALKDTANSNDIVFAGKTVEDGKAYDGTIVNYQVILPEDGSNGNTTATTYYIWIELY